jgi:Zn-dependent oligopeptidase
MRGGQVKAAKNFRAATTMLRQLQFSVTDLTLHSDFDPAGPRSIHDAFRGVAARYQVPRLARWCAWPGYGLWAAPGYGLWAAPGYGLWAGPGLHARMQAVGGVHALGL